jgi:multimeric flavodoxin WrbA
MQAGRGLNALFFNCSLTRDGSKSHTRLLLGAVGGVMARQGARVEHVHLLDHVVPPGIYPDMTSQGWDRDDWPELWEKVLAADILVVGTPIWLGEESSVTRVLIERLYAMSAELNDRGQSIFYGKAAGAVVTGNEDGVKHVSGALQFALNHLGYTIPPQADTGWIGSIGPGPSYGDDDGEGGRVGFDSDFTRQKTTILAWNLMHLARMLKAAGGYPREGNDREAWKAGERFGYEDPEVGA